MKNKNLIIVLALFACLPFFFAATYTNEKPAADSQWLQVTLIESTVGGGGRSRILMVDSDGNESEINCQNLFSVTGVNFKNIKQNNRTIVDVIADKAAAGWQLQSTSTGALGGGGSNGIYMTRYLFRK